MKYQLISLRWSKAPEICPCPVRRLSVFAAKIRDMASRPPSDRRFAANDGATTVKRNTEKIWSMALSTEWNPKKILKVRANEFLYVSIHFRRFLRGYNGPELHLQGIIWNPFKKMGWVWINMGECEPPIKKCTCINWFYWNESEYQNTWFRNCDWFFGHMYTWGDMSYIAMNWAQQKHIVELEHPEMMRLVFASLFPWSNAKITHSRLSTSGCWRSMEKPILNGECRSTNLVATRFCTDFPWKNGMCWPPSVGNWMVLVVENCWSSALFDIFDDPHWL